MKKHPEKSLAPIGWNFNPSNRSHRKQTAALAAVAFVMVSYLALCQLGLAHPWDPFFHEGTVKVLHSRVSKAIPIPDALLGASAYAFEVLLLLMGDEARWWTMRRITLLSGFLSLSLAAAGSILLFMQASVVHEGCSFCIVTTFLGFFIAQRSIPEILATLQTPLLQRDAIAPHAAYFDLPMNPVYSGTKIIWTLFLTAIVAAFNLLLVALIDLRGAGLMTLSLASVLALMASIFAIAEPVRFLRWANGAAGAVLVCWFLGQSTGAIRWIEFSVGLVFFFSIFHKGKPLGAYGFFSSPSETVRKLEQRAREAPSRTQAWRAA